MATSSGSAMATGPFVITPKPMPAQTRTFHSVLLWSPGATPGGEVDGRLVEIRQRVEARHDVVAGQRHLPPHLGVAPFVRIEQRKSAEADGEDDDDQEKPEGEKTQSGRRLHYAPCSVDFSLSSSPRTPSPRTWGSSPTTRWKGASRARADTKWRPSTCARSSTQRDCRRRCSRCRCARRRSIRARRR